MTERVEWKVDVGGEQVSAVYEPATSGPDDALYVMAHGAGGNMSDRAMLAAANALRVRGFGVVRFNFVYKEKKSGRPDPMPKCMNVVAAVVDQARNDGYEAASTDALLAGRGNLDSAASQRLERAFICSDGDALATAHGPQFEGAIAAARCRSGGLEALVVKAVVGPARGTGRTEYVVHEALGAADIQMGVPRLCGQHAPGIEAPARRVVHMQMHEPRVG